MNFLASLAFLALAAGFVLALFGGFAAAGLVWLIERVLG